MTGSGALATRKQRGWIWPGLASALAAALVSASSLPREHSTALAAPRPQLRMEGKPFPCSNFLSQLDGQHMDIGKQAFV